MKLYRGTKYKVLRSSPPEYHYENYKIVYLKKSKKYIFFGAIVEKWVDYTDIDVYCNTRSTVTHKDRVILEKKFRASLFREWVEV